MTRIELIELNGGVLAQARKAPWSVDPEGKVIFQGDDMNIQRFDWAYCVMVGARSVLSFSGPSFK